VSVLEIQVGVATAALRDAVTAALAASTVGPVDRACVVAGSPTGDGCDCGSLALTVTQVYQSTAFPNPAADFQLTANCPPPYVAVDVTVTVLRCAPLPVGNVLAPTCAALAAAAVVWFVDAETVRAALGCTLAQLAATGRLLGYALRDTTPSGPEGGCVGSDTKITLGLPNCFCPTR